MSTAFTSPSSGTASPITPASSAQDVVALLDHLGVERAHVVGRSMGGAVALELAVNHSDRVRSIVRISVTTLSASNADLVGWSDEQWQA